ncbi:MAG: cation:dicarboxylase symporter family transporter [Armatimonadetes bacterium]|nr:cation:dicarboxylase symporter family transporter [Armatimonadota bacterium]
MSAGKAIRSTAYIVVSIVVGIVIGLILQKNAAPLGSVGKFYIDLIKAVATPLLFFAILDAIVSSEVRWKSARRFLGVVVINTTIAATIGLTIANVFKPGKHLVLGAQVQNSSISEIAKSHKVNVLGFIENLLPKNIVEPFATSNILSVAFLAVLIGCALRSFKNLNEPWVADWERIVHGGYRLSEKVITWLVSLTPLAIGAVIAKSVGENGFAHLLGLIPYVGFVILGLCIQTFIVYPIWLIIKKRVSLRDFWREATPPVLNAFGINSSLATLPLTLKALDNLGISKESSRMGACIGTNLNNDGILLYEAFGVIIVSQAIGLDLSLSSQITIALMCVLTALGIAGVPEAGIISLAIILGTLGYSADVLLPILLTVDWIIARMRSVTNVVADMTTSIVIDDHPATTGPISVS